MSLWPRVLAGLEEECCVRYVCFKKPLKRNDLGLSGTEQHLIYSKQKCENVGTC